MRFLTAGAVILLLTVAAALALLWGYADRLYYSGSLDGIRRARLLTPARASYFAGDPADTTALENAVRLNPRLSAAWTALGLSAELAGDLPKAERLLLEAARMDRTYEPCWTLANFYFRRSDPDRFWFWARRAADIAYTNQAPLFQLCWRLSQDPDLILKRAIPDRREAREQYLHFLILQNRLDAAAPLGTRLAAECAPQSRSLMLFYCDRLIQAGRTGEAQKVWNALCRRGVLPSQPLATHEGRSLTNGDFSSPPLSTAFDWRLSMAEGITFTRPDTPPELRINFSGRQPETLLLLEQIVPLEPARRYSLHYSSLRTGFQPLSGLQWQASDLNGDTIWSAAPADLAGEGWTSGVLAFTTPAGATSGRIALRYQRALGTTRVEGSLSLRHLSLEID